MDSPALEIKDAKKVYASGTEALKGVSLSIPRGEFFALLGPNGAGKTSLISIISGLALKSSGTVSVCGVSIDQDAPKAKTFIGLVPQEFNFNIFEKVHEHHRLDQAGYYGIPRAKRFRAQRRCSRSSASGRSAMTFAELSGGMKRRLMIARALVHEPQGAPARRADCGRRRRAAPRHVGFPREAERAGHDHRAHDPLPRRSRAAFASQVAIIKKGEIIALNELIRS
jgi:ABC-type Fe3+/spermidine/putrescine transport system ATPase subunit